MYNVAVRLSNALCDVACWLHEHGHPTADERVIRLRCALDRWACRWLLGHPNVVYGPARDICLHCLTIVDEHPNGRGRR